MKKLMNKPKASNRNSCLPKAHIKGRLGLSIIALLMLSACGMKVHHGPPSVDSGNFAVDAVASLLGALLIMDEEDWQAYDEREKAKQERTIRQIGIGSAEER